MGKAQGEQVGRGGIPGTREQDVNDAGDPHVPLRHPVGKQKQNPEHDEARCRRDFLHKGLQHGIKDHRKAQKVQNSKLNEILLHKQKGEQSKGCPASKADDPAAEIVAAQF